MDHLGEFLIVGKALAAVQVGDVAPGHESLVARSRDDDRADGLIALQIRQRGLERQQGWGIQGVERLGTIDGQQAHGAVALAQDGVEFLGHRQSPRIG
ncbi:hypothetical protein D3C87_1848980 [compost metagenome]